MCEGRILNMSFLKSATPYRVVSLLWISICFMLMGVPIILRGMVHATENAPLVSIPVVSTIAVIGAPDVGDNRSAVGATLLPPFGLLAASDGSVYIADTFNNRVRRVTTDGIIHTVAGTGTAETQILGDGLPATQAQLRFPRAMDFGPDGS